MWRFTELHDEYRRKGWRQADFVIECSIECVFVWLTAATEDVAFH